MLSPQHFRNPLFEGPSKLGDDNGDWPFPRHGSLSDEATPQQVADLLDVQSYRMVRLHVTESARAQASDSQEFCNNRLVTSKYTFTTFLPVNLYQQFSRAANLYFLMNAVVQLIPGLSPTSWGTTVVPLSFVLVLNALKEAHDDIKRHKSDKEGQGVMPLDISQILLRGATLRNTHWVIGAVVFTGADTKYMRNMVPAPRKVSQLERKTNILVAGLFIFQLILCMGLAIGHFVWTDRNKGQYYLPNDHGWPELGLSLGGLLLQFLRFVVLLSSFIPISLYVTLELVKVMQCFFLNWDTKMYHEPTGVAAQTRTSNLNEELGQG